MEAEKVPEDKQRKFADVLSSLDENPAKQLKAEHSDVTPAATSSTTPNSTPTRGWTVGGRRFKGGRGREAVARGVPERGQGREA